MGKQFPFNVGTHPQAPMYPQGAVGSSGGVAGSGTVGRIPIWNATGTLADSSIAEADGVVSLSQLDIGSVSSIAAALLRIGGDIRAAGGMFAGDFVLEGPGGIPGAGGTGSPVAIYDEGTLLTSEVTALRFTGAGVTATNSGGDVTVTLAELFTQAMADARYSLLGHTHLASQVTDFNAVGDVRWLKLDGSNAMSGTLLALRGAFGISAAPASGSHVEVYGDGTGGAILAYNRTAGAYLPLIIGASSTTFTQGGIDVSGGVGTLALSLRGNINPYVGFNDGTYQSYLQMSGGDMQLYHNGSARLTALHGGGQQNYGQFDFLTADGSAYNMRVNSGTNVTFYKTLSMAADIVTNGNNIQVGQAIVGLDLETFAARGTTVPHYGWRWTTTTDVPGDSNTRLLGGGYGGISLFTNGGERLRISGAGLVSIYTSLDVTVNYNLGGAILAAFSSSYNQLYRRDGGIGIYLGGADPANYYDNGAHFFRNRAGTNLMTVNASGDATAHDFILA